MERIDGSRGLDDRESQAVDAAYVQTLRREYGEERLAEAHDRWRRLLRTAAATVRPREPNGQ
jgi:hypothetical protein